MSRIPRRTAISTTGNTPSSSRHNSVSGKRLSVNGSSSRPRTPTGLVSPASGVPARFVSILSVSQCVHLEKEKIWKFTRGQLTRILSNLDFVASSILMVETYIYIYILTTIVCIMSYYFTFRIPCNLGMMLINVCKIRCSFSRHFAPSFIVFCFSFSFLFLFFIILSFFFNYLVFLIIRLPTNEICEWFKEKRNRDFRAVPINHSIFTCQLTKININLVNNIFLGSAQSIELRAFQPWLVSAHRSGKLN